MSKFIIGVRLFPLREIPDPKGSVLHLRRNDDEDFMGFGECYCSEIKSGAIKAWKIHDFQIQNIAVPIGKIRLIIYDPRVNSMTKGLTQEIITGRPENYARIAIPAGVWYGFQGLSAETALLVNCTDKPHDPADNRKLPSDSPEIPYTW